MQARDALRVLRLPAAGLEGHLDPSLRRERACCHGTFSSLPAVTHSQVARVDAPPRLQNVNFDGQTYSFEVKPGPDGYRRFTDAIRRAFTLPEDSELNITFTCDEPGIGALHLLSSCVQTWRGMLSAM